MGGRWWTDPHGGPVPARPRRGEDPHSALATWLDALAGSKMVWSSGRGQVGWTGGDQGTVESGHHERKQSHVPGGSDKGQSRDSGLSENPQVDTGGPYGWTDWWATAPPGAAFGTQQNPVPLLPPPHTNTHKGPSTPPASLCRKAESPRPPRVTKEWLQQLMNTI